MMLQHDAQQIIRLHQAGHGIEPDTLQRARSLLGLQNTMAQLPVAPPYDVKCVCGMRFGQHRIGDQACQNKWWSPGNGHPQWLEHERFVRA